MKRPFDIFGHSVHAGASIGVAMAGPEHCTPELLIRDADFAMYRAKQEGGGRFEIFDKHLEIHVSSQQERERELRHVLDKRQFEIWYQPIYRLADGKLEGLSRCCAGGGADGSVDSFRDLLSAGRGYRALDQPWPGDAGAVCRPAAELVRHGLPSQTLTLTVNVTAAAVLIIRTWWRS